MKEKNIEKDIKEIMDYIKELKEENRKLKEKLEYIKALIKVYNNGEMHFSRGFDFINTVKEVLKNGK